MKNESEDEDGQGADTHAKEQNVGRKMFNDRGKRSREAWLQHRGEHRRGAPFMLYLLLMSNTPARGETEFIC